MLSRAPLVAGLAPACAFLLSTLGLARPQSPTLPGSRCANFGFEIFLEVAAGHIERFIAPLQTIEHQTSFERADD